MSKAETSTFGDPMVSEMFYHTVSFLAYGLESHILLLPL